MRKSRAAGKGFLKALAKMREQERRKDRDSGSGPKGENSRSEVEGEAPQSGLPQEGIAQPFPPHPKDSSPCP